MSCPIIVTSFGYNLLIPSLKSYLFNNKKYLLYTILLGSTIPLVVYVLWEYSISSFLTKLDNKLLIQTFFSLGNPTEKLIILISNDNNLILYTIFIFSFTALTSSLIGVSLNISDFFFDFLQLKKTAKTKHLILSLVFTLPLLFNILSPYIFMLALDYAGIFASILLILLPIFSLWYGRYVKKIKYTYLLFKNEILLFSILFFGIFIIFIDILEKLII